MTATAYAAKLGEARDTFVAAMVAWDDQPEDERKSKAAVKPTIAGQRKARQAVDAEGPLADLLGIPTATLRELVAGKRRAGLGVVEAIETVIEGVLG